MIGKIFGISTDRGQVLWSTMLQPAGFSGKSFVYLTRSSAAYPPEVIAGDATHLYKLNPISGELVSAIPAGSLLQVIPLPFLYTQSGTASHTPNTHPLLLVHAGSAASPLPDSLQASLYPEGRETTEVFQKNCEKLYPFFK